LRCVLRVHASRGWAIRQQLAGGAQQDGGVSVAMGARWPVARGPEANYGKCVSGPGPGPSAVSLAIGRVFSSPRGRSLSGITHGDGARAAGRKEAGDGSMAPSWLQHGFSYGCGKIASYLSVTVAEKLQNTIAQCCSKAETSVWSRLDPNKESTVTFNFSPYIF